MTERSCQFQLFV